MTKKNTLNTFTQSSQKRAHPNVIFEERSFQVDQTIPNTQLQEGGSRNKVAGVGWFKVHREFISETFQRISKYFFVRDSLS